MSYRVEKGMGGKEEIVIEGFEKGIASSPHAGIADLKNLNINSLPGEAAVNYNRVNTLPVISAGSLLGTVSGIEYVYGTNPKLVVGSAITIRNSPSSTITNVTSGQTYWVTSQSDTGTIQFIALSASYGGSNITPGTTGSATFDTYSFGKFVQGASEYNEYYGNYTYYLCDSNGVVWVNSPQVYGIFAPAGNADGIKVTANPTGFQVSQGVAFIFADDAFGGGIWANFTFTIDVYNNWSKVVLTNSTAGNTPTNHYAIQVPDQNGAIWYCDGTVIGNISSVSSDSSTIQRFSLMDVSCDGSTASLTINKYLQGVIPGDALPVVAVAKSGSSLPTGLSGSTQYYIKTGQYNQGAATLEIATSPTGSAITPTSAGSFYITSFSPVASFSAMVSYTKEAILLPYQENATCLGYFTTGNTTMIVIGTRGNNIYFGNFTQGLVDQLPLPEANTHRILNVDNTPYIFTGNKGNIYISNGTILAGALSVPDYVANSNGGNQDPYFKWGDAMFLRGRVFFSVQDQNSNNTTGNCGGVWSFTPVQNLFIGQDQGVGLHLENQNSYATYNGVCDVLLPSFTQTANGPQYWSAWSSDYAAPTYGIDFSGTSPYNGTQFGQIDTDIIPVGAYLSKYTPGTIEYKTARPLVSGESVQLLWRPDLSSSFTSLGTDSTVGDVAYAWPTTGQKLQWVQFRAKTISTTSNPSFVPLTEIRIRPS